MPSSTAAYVDATGIHLPAYSDVLLYFQTAFRTIYGQDIYIDPDSQDGQMLGILALAVSDNNSAFAQVYSNFSPQTAQGVGLSNAVQLNGIQREVASNSEADVLVSGTPGTQIINGQGTDNLNQVWLLPALVTIPVGTSITVAATAQNIGAVLAGANTITNISTPTRGWHSITNPAAAVPGAPIETDATLRVRQQVSTMIPSQSMLDGLYGALATLSGVISVNIYNNNTNATDSNGIPAKTVSVVIDGGDPILIANTIFTKKGIGCGTYGTTTETIVSRGAINNTINFYRSTPSTVQVTVSLKALTGYLSSIGTEIQTALVAYINSLTAGQELYFARLYVPASLTPPDGNTFNILSITVGKNGGSQSAANITTAFNERLTAVITDMTLVVT